MKNITSSVAFQDEQGNVLSNGSLLLSLPPGAYAIVAGGGQVYGGTIIVNLDATGRITGTVSIWASDEISPQTAYNVTLCAQANGFQPVASALWFIGGVSPIDLSLMTPSVTGPSYSGAVVLNPSAQQTINGQPLVMENAQIGFSAVGSTSGDAWFSRVAANIIGVGTFANGTDGRLRLDNGSTQSTPVLSVRRSTLPNNLEFGSTNSAGFGCNIGAESSSNTPFVAFMSEAGTNANTYRTRGNTASIIRATTSGVIQFGSVSNANADNQTFTSNAQIDATTGNITGVIVKGTSTGGGTVAGIQASGTNASLLVQNTAAAADNKVWDIASTSTSLQYRVLNDALNTIVNYITVTRSGATVSSVVFGAGGGSQTLPTGTGTLAFGIPKFQQFTANGTFTIPAGVTGVKVVVVGGGGAGGGANTNNGGGGGAAGAAIKYLSGLTPGNTLAVTVGAGGTGVSNANGNAGGNSTVASGTQTISTVTGGGGGGGQQGATVATGGTAGTASGGDFNFTGSSGNWALVANTGAHGAASIFGGAGPLGFLGAASAGTSAGSGGGGSGSGGGAVAGGAGAGGIVIFEWAA